MTRGKIWDYLHNGVGEEYVGEKSVIIPSSSDDGDKDLSDDNDGDGGDGIKVTINRKLDLLRDEPPNQPSPSPLALFLSGVVPSVQGRGWNSFGRNVQRSSRATLHEFLCSLFVVYP